MAEISKLAAVDPEAKIGKNVTIGPFCVIGPHVEIGEGCELMNNVTIQGVTHIGPLNVFYPNAIIGVTPQDLKYDGSPTQTLIGFGNVVRENVTVHRGTELGGGKTVIGNENLLMVGVHIAHDCVIGNRTIIGNQTQLAGHVAVQDNAVISALVGLHHFVTVGRNSYIGGLTPVRRDVPPFMKFDGDPNEVRGLNEEGLRRHGFSDDDIAALKEAYRQLFRNTAITSGLDALEKQGITNPHVQYLCEFMRRSCASRFARSQESERKDANCPKQGRRPLELRVKDRRKGERK